MDTDGTRSVRIQSGVQYFVEGRVHVSLQITDIFYSISSISAFTSRMISLIVNFSSYDHLIIL